MAKQPRKKKLQQSIDTAKCQPAYLLPLSFRFLLLSLGLGVLTPFYLGQIARQWLLSSQQQQQQQQQHAVLGIVGNTVRDVISHSSLPPPVLGAADELPPSTRYTTKHYEAKGTGSESFLVRNSPAASSTKNKKNGDAPKKVTTTTKPLPSLSFVPKSSLNQPVSTESQIVDLLNSLVAESSDTILSYHCHHSQHRQSSSRSSGSSISCVGIASHGHIAVHTFQDYIALTVVGIDLNADSTWNILGQSLAALQGTSATTTTTKPETTLEHPLESKSDRVASAFVHPVLFVHNKPEMVVLVGGTKSTVEQILLHNTIAQLVVLDMMEEVDITTPATRTTTTIATTKNERVEIIRPQNQTAAEWFATSPNVTTDVILIESASNISPAMASNVSRVLKNDGLLLMKADRSETSSKLHWIEELTDEYDYDIIKEYHDGETDFFMAFADDAYLGQFFANEAEVNLKIHQRVPSSPLPHFDGTIMQSYQYPNRIAEDVFCHQHLNDPICQNGHGFVPAKTLVPISSFEVKLSTVENAGRGVYLTHDAEEGAYIFVDGCVHNIHFPDNTVNIIDDFVEGEYKIKPVSKWETLTFYAHGYGFVHEEFGPQAHDVDPGIGTFVNHGCNGTTNVGSEESKNLTEFSPAYTPADPRTIYHPMFDRSLRTFSCSESLALRNIAKGEEIFNNYMLFENVAELEEYAESLRNECAGKAVGQVSEYELSAQGNQLLRPHVQANAS